MSLDIANNITSTGIDLATNLTSSGLLGEGIGFWGELAHIIRISSRGGQLYPPFDNSTMNIISTDGASQYYLVIQLFI
jgi:hypothetical protein